MDKRGKKSEPLQESLPYASILIEKKDPHRVGRRKEQKG